MNKKSVILFLGLILLLLLGAFFLDEKLDNEASIIGNLSDYDISTKEYNDATSASICTNCFNLESKNERFLNCELLTIFKNGGKLGFKDCYDNIVVPARYDKLSGFNNIDKTAVSGWIENDLFYIDKSGTDFLKIDNALHDYTDFYNGVAYYNSKFIDEQGNTIYEFKEYPDAISYWGNGYFESYYLPSYCGIGYRGHSFFIDKNGNKKLYSSNINVSELTNGYAIVNGNNWCTIIDSYLEVKAIFINTITCEPNYILTDLSFDLTSEKNLLKIRKGYQPLTEPYKYNEMTEIESVFGYNFSGNNVMAYIYSDGPLKINIDKYNKNDYEYDFVDISKIINEN